jgi:hypothetical protein
VVKFQPDRTTFKNTLRRTSGTQKKARAVENIKKEKSAID